MNNRSDQPRPFTTDDTLRPKLSRRLQQVEVLCQVVGVAAVVVRHGLQPTGDVKHLELSLVVIFAMLFLTASTGLRYQWSLARSTFLRTNRSAVVLGLLWLTGLVGILLFGPFLPTWHSQPISRGTAFIAWSELFIVLRGFAGVVSVTRRVAAGGHWIRLALGRGKQRMAGPTERIGVRVDNCVHLVRRRPGRGGGFAPACRQVVRSCACRGRPETGSCRSRPGGRPGPHLLDGDFTACLPRRYSRRVARFCPGAF